MREKRGEGRGGKGGQGRGGEGEGRGGKGGQGRRVRNRGERRNDIGRSVTTESYQAQQCVCVPFQR